MISCESQSGQELRSELAFWTLDLISVSPTGARPKIQDCPSGGLPGSGERELLSRLRGGQEDVPASLPDNPEKQQEITNTGRHFVSEKPRDATNVEQEAYLEPDQIEGRQTEKVYAQEGAVAKERPPGIPYQWNRSGKCVQYRAGNCEAVELASRQEGVETEPRDWYRKPMSEREEGIAVQRTPGSPFELIAEHYEYGDEADPQRFGPPTPIDSLVPTPQLPQCR